MALISSEKAKAKAKKQHQAKERRKYQRIESEETIEKK